MEQWIQGWNDIRKKSSTRQVDEICSRKPISFDVVDRRRWNLVKKSEN